MSLLYHPLPISAYACSRFPSLGAALHHAGFHRSHLARTGQMAVRQAVVLRRSDL